MIRPPLPDPGTVEVFLSHLEESNHVTPHPKGALPCCVVSYSSSSLLQRPPSGIFNSVSQSHHHCDLSPRLSSAASTFMLLEAIRSSGKISSSLRFRLLLRKPLSCSSSSKKSGQGLLALRPLSDFLAVRRFREVPKICFSPS